MLCNIDNDLMQGVMNSKYIEQKKQDLILKQVEIFAQTDMNALRSFNYVPILLYLNKK